MAKLVTLLLLPAVTLLLQAHELLTIAVCTASQTRLLSILFLMTKLVTLLLLPAAALLLQADELFTTGTAVVVCSVGSLTYKGTRKEYSKVAGEPGLVALDMYNSLTRLQTEQDADPFGWVYKVC